MSYAKRMLDQLDKGQLKEAKKSFIWALRKDDDETLFNLAEELYGLGFDKRAKRIYEKLLQSYPDDDELRSNLAEIEIDEGNNDKALNYLAEIKPGSDAYVQSLLVAADLYQTEGELEVSASKLQEAYRQDPDEPAVLFANAELFYLMGNFERAIPYYFALIQKGYTDFAKVDLAGRLAMSYAQSGRYEQALGYFKQVEPGALSSNIRFQMGMTQLHLKDYAAAEKTLNALIENDPDYASAYPQLAIAQEDQGNYEGALKTMQEGLGIDQYNEQLFMMAGQLADRLGQNKLASQYLIKAHQLNPDSLTITLALSEHLIMQGDHRENLDLLLPLINNDEVDPQVEWNLARSYQSQDELDKAGKFYQAAALGLKDDSQFLHDYADWAREAGKPQIEKSALVRYVNLVPTDTEMAQRLDELNDDNL